MITKNSSFSFPKQDVIDLIKHNWKQFLGIGVVLWFLIFLLNLFVWVSAYTDSFGDTLKEKLWIYFYIKNVPEQESIVYKKIIDLQSKLQKQWLKVMFSSKDDAMKFLESKMPNITENFSKFGIDNTLPSTLFVMFSNKDQYEILKTTILEYKDIILNIKDIDAWNNIKQQENRSLDIINLTNFITAFSIIIVILLAFVILIFIGLLSNVLFKYMQKHIEIKNLLGWLSNQMIKEFISINVITLVFWFIIWFILLVVSWSIFGVLINWLFDVWVLEIFTQSSIWIMLWWFVLEMIIFAFASIIFSYFYTTYSKKQL